MGSNPQRDPVSSHDFDCGWPFEGPRSHFPIAIYSSFEKVRNITHEAYRCLSAFFIGCTASGG
jgi:hypothetical protein